MVKNQIESRGISHPRVLDALKTVPRHRFVPEKNRNLAYNDYPLPIVRNWGRPCVIGDVHDFMRFLPNQIELMPILQFSPFHAQTADR
ncbi:MAG: hypothetical protein C4522_13400 [Desulfobacteraceae bacterium]|nr:MAG: hypothetical protein C4522_13400 [Desulfobacteraceae bacterium]